MATAHREEVGAAHGPEEDDRHEGEVGAVHDAGDEDLLQLPAVRVRGRLHPVLGDGHDRSCVHPFVILFSSNKQVSVGRANGEI